MSEEQKMRKERCQFRLTRGKRKRQLCERPACEESIERCQGNEVVKLDPSGWRCLPHLRMEEDLLRTMRTQRTPEPQGLLAMMVEEDMEEDIVFDRACFEAILQDLKDKRDMLAQESVQLLNFS